MTAGVPCAGAVILDAGRLLLIQRGQPPQAGCWSLPGGRIEAGESPAEAAVREVAEETGLAVVVDRLLGRVQLGPYDVWDYAASLTGAEPGEPAEPALRAGSDAADARWFRPAEVHTLALTTGLAEALTRWDVLPRRPTTQ